MATAVLETADGREKKALSRRYAAEWKHAREAGSPLKLALPTGAFIEGLEPGSGDTVVFYWKSDIDMPMAVRFREAFDKWSTRYAERLLKENSNDDERMRRMNKINPKYILRNYLAEIAIRKAEDDKDYTEIEKLFSILQHPFDEWPEHKDYAGHSPDWAQQISVSCSS